MAKKKNRAFAKWVKRILWAAAGLGLVAMIVVAFLPKPVPVDTVPVTRGALRVTAPLGVGRRIVMRQIGASLELTFGQIKLFKLDQRKRSFEIEVYNPADKNVVSEINLQGLWGSEVAIAGERISVQDGVLKAEIELPPLQSIVIKGNVIE